MKINKSCQSMRM